MDWQTGRGLGGGAEGVKQNIAVHELECRCHVHVCVCVCVFCWWEA